MSKFNRFLATFLLAASLLLAVVGFVAAQEPPAKGPEPTPAPVTLPPAAPVITPTPAAPNNPALLSKIEPQLLKRLLEANGGPVSFVAYLHNQVDVNTAGLQAQSDDPLTRRQALVEALQQTARQSQSGVLQQLHGGSGVGIAAADVTPLWIVNAVAAKGTLETVAALAARPEVAVVRWDAPVQIDRTWPADSPLTGTAARPSTQSVEWNIAKIRAEVVRYGLNIDGSGVVVATIDTGVDWLHPALQSRYRGYTGPGKLPQHEGNWFDATGDGAAYPVDTKGHGTHTMGTIAGLNGIGVAPGAQWITARAFDSNGSAQNSWLHSAFQWVLAPNGNPALAPQVVNNSWGNNNGADTEFEPDINALLAAGILPVFSAGNEGPGEGTVGSPGSLNNAFAVGATDVNDDIANFSSRGPSPWGQIKPEIAAPGKAIRSSLPGGTYGVLNGTSMAAPHVTGLAALLIQADPALSRQPGQITFVITSTATALGSGRPNNNYGWGRIEAYNAVMAVVSAGVLQGIIADASGGGAIDGAVIQMTPNLGGAAVSATSDAQGNYLQGLAPDFFDVSVSAFGYWPTAIAHIEVVTGTPTIRDFQLVRQNTGTLAGAVTDLASGAPLSATITIENAPVSAQTHPVDGKYQLSLPVGVYTVTVTAANHRLGRASNVAILTGITNTRNFALESAPSILLVDSGAWYQESKIDYYRQALTDAGYTADLWQIKAPFSTPSDIPTAEALAPYELVIWSAPLDSPGYVGAGEAIADYLDGGGKLLLSGQDVAYYDGGGYLVNAPYLRNYLKASYLIDNAGTDSVVGLPGQPFAGFNLSLSGGDGANNQTAPDGINNLDVDVAVPVFQYQDTDWLAGLYVARCVNYRAIFLAFGVESISTRLERQQTIAQAIDSLVQPPAPSGVELTPTEARLIGDFGAVVSHTFRLRNTGVLTDSIALTANQTGPYFWQTAAVSSPVTLGPCANQTIAITVQIPADAARHITDTLTVQAQSGHSLTTTAAITRHTKTPAPVLLVDDDRWYSFAAEYQQALDLNQVQYDYWYVPKSWAGEVAPSPPPETLRMYPLTLWYTAYDWFAPLHPAEETRLMDYLDNGGRLFFSSQDFLYKHLVYHGGYAPFATAYLGVLAHTEDFSSTQTIGEAGNPVGNYLGSYPLTFPPGYRNWTDALTPTTITSIATRGQENQPNGLTMAGVGPNGREWHTNFLAYGPELLTAEARARLLQRSLGWLSWLGGSTVTAQAESVSSGGLITYTATIRNNGWETIPSAGFTATFPAYLTPVWAAPALSAVGDTFVWQGSLAAGEQKSFEYVAQLNQTLAAGEIIEQTSWLGYPLHTILFDRVAAIPLTADLSQSGLSVSPAAGVVEGDTLTFQLVLRNNGVLDADPVTVTSTLPASLELLPLTDSGVTGHPNGFSWVTAVKRGGTATLSYQARVISQEAGGGVVSTVLIKDSLTPTITVRATAMYKTVPVYLPLVVKESTD
jgi:uncharacterized repeat protein (TIGR01451 family)